MDLTTPQEQTDVIPGWSQVSLPGGTLVMVSKELTPFPLPPSGTACLANAGATFYWRDDHLFDDRTGADRSAYGDHSMHIQCTADTNLSPCSQLASHYFLPPQPVYSPVGADYASFEAMLITASPEMQTRAAVTTCTLTVVEQAGGGALMFSWIDALGEDGHEIYRGDTVTWTTPDDQETGQPSYYYLIVPRRGTDRRYGTDSAGTTRPPSSSECP
jgi:hypothetical protein